MLGLVPRQRRPPNVYALARTRAGLTQTEAARALGIQQPSVSKWERGRGRPGRQHLAQLSAIYKWPMEDLVHGRLPNDLTSPVTGSGVGSPPHAASSTTGGDSAALTMARKSEARLVEALLLASTRFAELAEHCRQHHNELDAILGGQTATTSTHRPGDASDRRAHRGPRARGRGPKRKE